MDFTIFPNNEKIDFSRKLNVKFGIDPTSDKLHLGHLIPLMVAKKLWKEGHNIQIVLGTFTAQLGDPSGKDTMRPIIDQDTTKLNADSITKQIHRVFGNYKESGTGVVSIFKNHTWFESMNSIEMINILSKFTTAQLLARDSFQKRIEDENPIGMHELIVPVLQGMDSVQLASDVEIGGTDQLFNFAITRDMQRIHGQEPEKCILMPIINGTDGRKMSKSFGNCIFLNDSPEDVFGKVMSISDELMKEWWPVFFSVEQINMNFPMDQKKRLAFQITTEIWSFDEADKAQQHFENKIQNKQVPDDIQEIAATNVLSAVVAIRKCSITEAKRLISQGAVRVHGNKVSEVDFNLQPGDIVKVGKLDFAKIN